MATDPDSDRIGIAVKDENNEWILFNGSNFPDLHLLPDYPLERTQGLMEGIRGENYRYNRSNG